METDALATIQQLYNTAYGLYNNIRKEIEKKIETKEAQIERLKKRQKKNWNELPRWTDFLVRPIVAEIEKQLPEWKCEDDRFTPMGLGSRVHIFFYRKDEPPKADGERRHYVYIVLMPGSLDKGELHFETGEKDTHYRSGTIGEVNGFNNISKPLESISEAVAFLKSQIKRLGYE